jgi:hypothetical protein
MRLLQFKKGFAHVGMLALFLAVGALVATVYVAKSGTGFTNQAFEKQKDFVGTIRKVNPCASGNLCFQLNESKNGKTHYLLARKGILTPMAIDLSKFVSEKKQVKVSGQQVDKVKNGKSYILVKSVAWVKDVVSVPKTLAITEFGTISKEDEPKDYPVGKKAKMKVSNEGAEPASGGTVGNSSPANKLKCKVDSSGREICLLDGQMPPRVVSKFVLMTADGRRYPIINRTGGSPCPPGAYCTQVIRDAVDLEKFVGKMVFVEGVLNRKSVSDSICSREIYPPPSGCGKNESWWPLSSGLEFEVTNVQEAWLIVPKIGLKDVLQTTTGKETRNVYQFANLKPCVQNSFLCISPITGAKPIGDQIFARSSEIDLKPYVAQTLDAVGSVYGTTGGEVYFDVWYANNSPQPPVKNKISWKTDSGDVVLSADDFYIETAGKKFYGGDNLQLHSDPPDPTSPNSTTLEATWNENGVEMRLYMYFNRDSSKWWTTEMRTYDGSVNGDWVYFKNYSSFPGGLLGQNYSFSGSYFLHHNNVPNEPGNSTIYFNNLKLKAFANLVITSPSSPPTLGKACMTNNDCQNFICKPPMNCAHVMSSLRCVNKVCRFGDADL